MHRSDPGRSRNPLPHPRPTPSIRPLSADDSLAELTDLLHRAYAGLAEQGMRFYASHQTEDMTAQRVARGECLVAECDGRLVGTVTLVPPGRAGGCAVYEKPGVSTLHQLAVDPLFRGLGLGSSLLGAAERRAMELGARRIALDTAEPAAELRAWYGRRGYALVGAADWRPTVNYTSVVLVKELPLPRQPTSSDAESPA
jgi:GNAT superfamily N-acetyltransferase